MPTRINIVFTGICTFLTANGVPTEVVLPNAGGHVPAHASWAIINAGSVDSHKRPVFTRNGTSFYFIEGEQLSIAEAITESSVEPDPTTWPHVVDLEQLVKKNKLKKTYTTQRNAATVNALMVLKGGALSAPIWTPTKWKLKHEDGSVKIEDCIAQAVLITMKTDASQVTLDSAPISGAAQMPSFTITPKNDVVTILIGNTTYADIVPASSTPLPVPQDKHFGIYYDLFETAPGQIYFPDLTNASCTSPTPVPPMAAAAKARVKVESDRSMSWIWKRFGGGGNCPPAKTLKID